MEIQVAVVLLMLANGYLTSGAALQAYNSIENMTLVVDSLQPDPNENLSNDAQQYFENNIIRLPESSSDDINKVHSGNSATQTCCSNGLTNLFSKVIAMKVINQEVQFLGRAIINKISEKIEHDLTDRENDKRKDNKFVNKKNKSDKHRDFIHEKRNHDRLSSKTKTNEDYVPSSNGQLSDVLFAPFGSPEVSVIVASPRARGKDNVIQVPLEADMTVLDAFIAATRTYVEQHGQSNDIPFNVLLDWNSGLRCFTIVKALDFYTRRRAAWFVTVTNGSNEVYKGRCLPEDSVILRPTSTVTVKLERIRRRSRQ